MATARYSPQYAGSPPRPGLTAMAMANPLDEMLTEVEKFGQRAGMEMAVENATEAVLSGQQPSMKLPITQAAVAYNRAATEAYSAKTEADLRGKVAELSAQFPGRNPTDPDNFAKMYDAHASSLLAAVPEGMRARLGLEVQTRRQMALAGITEAAQRFEFQRNVSALEKGLEADIEEAAIAARDGASPDVIGALYARADGRVDELVNLGVINPEEAEIRKAERRSIVQAEAIFGDAVRSGNLTGVLSELERGGPIAEGLTLRARDRLAGRLQSELAHIRSEQNHALAVQAKVATQQTRALSAYTAKIDMGIPLSPAEQQQFAALVGGESLADPVKVEEARAAARTGAVTRDVATATPQQIDAVRALFASTPPATIEEAKVREAAVKAMDARERGLRDDPMGWAMQANPGQYPSVSLPSSPMSPEFDATLDVLADNADKLRAQYEVDGSPFPKDQKPKLALWATKLPPDQQLAMLGKISAKLGDRAAYVFEDLAKDGQAPGLAHAGWLVSRGQWALAESILNGQQVLRAKLVNPYEAKQKLAAIEDKKLYGVIPTSTAEQIVTAAEALAADYAMKNGTLPDLDDMVEQVGGKVGSYKGKQILLPLGVTDPGEFADSVEQVSDAEVAAMGGTPEAAAALRAGSAVLESRGDGKYAVRIGATVAPFLFDYNLVTPKAARPGFIRQYVAEPFGAAVDVGLEGARNFINLGPQGGN